MDWLEPKTSAIETPQLARLPREEIAIHDPARSTGGFCNARIELGRRGLYPARFPEQRIQRHKRNVSCRRQTPGKGRLAGSG